LAQASQSSGDTLSIEGTASSVISDDAIVPKIAHCSSDFKGRQGSPLVPRTQRFPGDAKHRPEAVRCRAGAHLAAQRAAPWVPALRSNADALQLVRDTGKGYGTNPSKII
jgi:hypothetical protein